MPYQLFDDNNKANFDNKFILILILLIFNHTCLC